MDQADRIREYLGNEEESLVEFLKELVLAESPTTVPESQAAPLMMLTNSFESFGYEVSITPGPSSGGMLKALAPHGHLATQLLIGHCDTVWPLGTLKTMPYGCENGQLRGPGIYDMKAGLTQIVFAIKAMRALDLKPSVQPVVLVNSDEETGSVDSEPTIRELASSADRALIMEPSLGRDGLIKTERKGVGQFIVKVKGKAAHAGLNPEEGTSAILELSYQIQKLFALNDPTRGITVNVGTIDGGMRPNVVAPESHAVVDVRVRTMEDARWIEDQIHGLRSKSPHASVEIEGQVSRPPLEKTPRNNALWQRAKHLGQALGLELEDGMAGGASDGNTTSIYTATLDGLGAVGGGAHAEHEFVFRDSLVERTSLLALLMLSPPLGNG